MKTIRIAVIFFLLPYALGSSATMSGRDRIDIVMCLDLSASTNGLIDDVREKLWDIINEVNSYRPAPALRIGIVAFSRPSFGTKNGYVKVLHSLSNDFDHLAFELYKIRPVIEKGDQLVGEALKVSVKRMNWSEDPSALKIIYLAGNGLVTLGGSDYRDACETAVERNIIVHTLYCRTRNNVNRELPGWREIARISNGEQYDIRIHKRPPLILAPDPEDRINQLAQQLNATYIYYGNDGAARFRMMKSVDAYAKMANPMAFQSRLFHKISDRYQLHQASWDLVDHLKMTNTDFEDVDMELLHDSLKFSTRNKLMEVVYHAKDERVRVIHELRKFLPHSRQSIIKSKYEKKGIDKADILERVVINTLDQAAGTKGFTTIRSN